MLYIIIRAVDTQGSEAAVKFFENFLSNLFWKFIKSRFELVKFAIYGKWFLNKLGAKVYKFGATQILMNVDTQTGYVADWVRKLKLAKLFKVDALDALFPFLHSIRKSVTQDIAPVWRGWYFVPFSVFLLYLFRK